MNKQLIFSTLAAVALFLAACHGDFLIDQKKEVAGKSWAYADTLRFDFDLADTGRLYSMFVDVEHTDHYAWENLYVKIHTVFPSGKRQEKVRSLQLATPAGKWLGSGSGDKITARVVLQEHTAFREPGHYALIFEQWMRQDTLPGIRAIGLAVERTEERRVEKKK